MLLIAFSCQWVLGNGTREPKHTCLHSAGTHRVRVGEGLCLWEIRLATKQMVPLVIPKATPIALPGSVSKNHRLSSPTLFILQMKKRMFREV